jgi:hypothetical protein
MLNFKNLSPERRDEFKVKLIEQCASDPELTAALIQCAAYTVALKGLDRQRWLDKCGKEFDSVKAQVDRL